MLEKNVKDTDMDMDYCEYLIVLYRTITDFRIYKLKCSGFHILICFCCEKRI